MTFSLQGMNFHISGRLVEDYWLHRLYPDPVRQCHESGDFHIHDTSVLGPYCVGWDLMDLLTTGFRGVKGKVASKPPKHFRAALGQAVNFMFTLKVSVQVHALLVLTPCWHRLSITMDWIINKPSNACRNLFLT